MFYYLLAKEVGISSSHTKRWAKAHGVNINAVKYLDHVVKEVCEYYARHGKLKTQKKFPNVRIRSIIERYATEPRQIRWKADQLVELVKMAGLVSRSRQAEIFNRPNAHAGSITSAWMKKFGTSGSSVNGLSRWVARHYVTFACPFYETGYWEVPGKGVIGARRRVLALWVDVAAHLRPTVPEHLADAIRAMAKFQRWLHGEDPRASILKILEGETP